MIPGFSRFAKDYVEERINAWQTKGEFEKAVDYRERIETLRDTKIRELTAEAKEKYIKDQQPENLKAGMTLGTYNADAEAFVISHPQFGDFVVHIPVDEAPEFKNYWFQLQAVADYMIENDRIALRSVSFNRLRGKTKRSYQAHRANGADYAEAEIDFDFDPINIDGTDIAAAADSYDVPAGKRKKTAVKSDIDINIPAGVKTANTNTFAVVLANENYRRVSKVDYAHNDGDMVCRYLSETLGVPPSQIHYVKDATLNDMRGEIEWMREVGEAYKGEASFIFYYAGHGIPDESTANGYLLPVDGYGSLASSGLPMKELNEKISAIPSRLSLVLLDACFSGAMRDGDMLAATRGVVIKVRPEAVSKGNVVVLTAAQNDEVAAKSDEYGHGLFTYYFLKKIQESKGNVKLGVLADYVVEQVCKYSVVQNRKPQTPSVLTSPVIKDSWSEITLTNIAKSLF